MEVQPSKPSGSTGVAARAWSSDIRLTKARSGEMWSRLGRERSKTNGGRLGLEFLLDGGEGAEKGR